MGDRAEVAKGLLSWGKPSGLLIFNKLPQNSNSGLKDFRHILRPIISTRFLSSRCCHNSTRKQMHGIREKTRFRIWHEE